MKADPMMMIGVAGEERTPAMNLPGLIPVPPMILDRPAPETRQPGTILCPYCQAEYYPGKGIRCSGCYHVLPKTAE